MKRTRAWFGAALLAAGVAALTACTSPITNADLAVAMNPRSGNVPFEAKIECFAPQGTFTLDTGTEVIGPQEDGEFVVTVDRFDWVATLTWTDGETILTREIEAYATNPAPYIRGIRINGNSNLWQLEPRERTLLEALVDYAGEWHVSSFTVKGSNDAFPYSVFYPPYVPGVCHAYWMGWIIENACIVYPVYTSIETDGLPYTPSTLDTGYPYSNSGTTNVYTYGAPTDEGLEIPPQQGTVTVEVTDEFGRLTTRSFTVPIQGLDYRDTK